MSSITSSWRNSRASRSAPLFAASRPCVAPPGVLCRIYNIDRSSIFDIASIDVLSRIAGGHKASIALGASNLDGLINSLNASVAFGTMVSLIEERTAASGWGGFEPGTLMIPYEIMAALGDEACNTICDDHFSQDTRNRVSASITRMTDVVYEFVRAGVNGPIARPPAKWFKYRNNFNVSFFASMLAWDPHDASRYVSVIMAAIAHAKSNESIEGLCYQTIDNSPRCHRSPTSIVDQVAFCLIVLTQLSDEEYRAYSTAMGVPASQNLCGRRPDYNRIGACSVMPSVLFNRPVFGIPCRPTFATILRAAVDDARAAVQRERAAEPEPVEDVEDDNDPFRVIQRESLLCDEVIDSDDGDDDDVDEHGEWATRTPILFSDSDDESDSMDHRPPTPSSCTETELINSDDDEDGDVPDPRDADPGCLAPSNMRRAACTIP